MTATPKTAGLVIGTTGDAASHFEADYDALLKWGKVITKRDEQTAQMKYKLYGQIHDMARKARTNDAYLEDLIKKYGKPAYGKTVKNPAALILGDQNIIVLSPARQSNLRVMYAIADEMDLTGNELETKLMVKGVSEFVRENQKLLPEPEQKKPKKPPKKKDTVIPAAPAAIPTATVSEPPPASGAAPLPLAEFTSNLPLEGGVGETVFFSALTLVSGPVVIVGTSDRGYFTPTVIMISAMTTVHSAAGAEVPVVAPPPAEAGGVGAEGEGESVPEPDKAPPPFEAGGAGAEGGGAAKVPEPAPLPEKGEAPSLIVKTETMPPKLGHEHAAQSDKSGKNSKKGANQSSKSVAA